jgi:hypothetical protein
MLEDPDPGRAARRMTPAMQNIWNLCTSDKSDVKSISKYMQVYDGIYRIY